MSDLGIACGRGMGLIFQDGKIVASLPEDKLIDGLMAHVWRIASERYGVSPPDGVTIAPAAAVPVAGAAKPAAPAVKTAST